MIDSFDVYILRESDMDKVWDEYENFISNLQSHPEETTNVRLRQMQMAYAIAKYLIVGKNGIICSYKLHEPFYSMGSISFEGRTLEFGDIKWFTRLTELATNTEVYPLVKNAIRLTFTFHGVGGNNE